MASVPFVIERRLQYHGIWNAGYNIGELFLKNISKDFVTKPPFPSILKLSISSLILTVYQKGGHSQLRALREDSIPFGSIRDVAVNSFNNRCLMIIYVNNKNKFSVLVTSCRNAKETTDIAMAFKSLSAIAVTRTLKTDKTNANWIMRKGSPANNSPSITPLIAAADNSINNSNHRVSTEEQYGSRRVNGDPDGRGSAKYTNAGANVDDEIIATIGSTSLGTAGHSMATTDSDVSSIKSRTESSVLAENFDFLKDHEDEESVFDDSEMCDKEQGPGENSISVLLQVDIQDRSDRISINSESSFSSFQSIRDEIDSVTPSSSIAEEEYSIKWLEVPLTNEGNNDVSLIGDGGTYVTESSLVNGFKDKKLYRITKIDESCKNYDFRGIGTQTESLGRTRYTKRSGPTGSSNIYKAMSAQRKLKQNSEEVSRPPPQQNVTSPAIDRAMPTSYHFSNGVREGSGGYQQQHNLSRTARLHTGSRSTVSRPIEEVYQRPYTWSRKGAGDPRRRHVIVVQSGRSSLRI